MQESPVQMEKGTYVGPHNLTIRLISYNFLPDPCPTFAL
jgi:hypothetical protein